MNPFEIIKTVRLTEKGTRQSEKYNQYTVVADRLATKPQIRQAVQELFKVKVDPRQHAERPRQGPPPAHHRRPAMRPNWKKAIVTLKEGDKIVLT